MTVVAATPPPRLPVRDRSAGSREGRVSPMLARPAAEEATGVLVRACGDLYPAEGRVVHAGSPFAPGLDVLLTAHGTLEERVWRKAADRADTGADCGRDAGHLLLDAGLLTPGALELCHLDALYDAAYFALAPSSTPGRFHHGRAHWLGCLHSVPVAAVEHETLRRRALLHRVRPDPTADTAPLRPARPPATAPAVAPRQAAVPARVDGVRRATDIARELGRPAFHTLVDVRRLTAAGRVVPRPPATAPAPSTTPPSPVPPAAAPPEAGAEPRADLRTADPDIALLKRVRDALEAL